MQGCIFEESSPEIPEGGDATAAGSDKPAPLLMRSRNQRDKSDILFLHSREQNIGNKTSTQPEKAVLDGEIPPKSTQREAICDCYHVSSFEQRQLMSHAPWSLHREQHLHDTEPIHSYRGLALRYFACQKIEMPTCSSHLSKMVDEAAQVSVGCVPV